MNSNEKFQPLRKGLLELAVLSIISAGRVYAADVLNKLSGTEFATAEGTLYPLLSRLRREGLLRYEWAESDTGPPRKYYYLTGAGQDQLSALTTYMRNINETIVRLGENHE